MELKADSEGAKLQTYFVYDDKGNLAYVVPPKTVQGLSNQMPKVITAGDLRNGSYHYVYDHRNRLIEQHIPGAEPVFIIYDPWDRLVLSQDGEQRTESRWNFYKYDAFDRTIMSGEIIIKRSRSQVEQDVSNFYSSVASNSTIRYESKGNFHGYTNRSYPLLSESSELYVIAFFDDYSFLPELPSPSSYEFEPELNLKGSLEKAVGLQTAINIRVLGTPDYVYSVTYYDDDYNPIQLIRSNHNGSRDRLTQIHTFRGLLSKMLHTHEQEGLITTILKEYVYDHAERPTSVYHKINNEEKVLLYEHSYNELDELVEKNLYSVDEGETFAQSVDYRYNIRGWLTSINNAALNNEGDKNDDSNDLFGMELYYNEEMSDLGNTPQYNGNISAVKWKNAHFNEEQAYVYGYDFYNRLKVAQYRNFTIPAKQSAYDVSHIDYDVNGNMVTIKRFGWLSSSKVLIDDLRSDFLGNTGGNQLSYVLDDSGHIEGFQASGVPGDPASSAYSYDVNGNMILAGNKGIRVSYNHMNLPEHIVKENSGEHIRYSYDGKGVKLSQKVFDASNTLIKQMDYVRDFVYREGELQYIHHDKGIILPNPTEPGWVYHYYLKDHLGNVRLTFAVQEGELTKVHVDDYYPFGLQMAGNHYQDATTNGVKHLYNGKELQDDIGLNWYDYGARMYDMALGRWHVVDPHMEEYYSHSPFVYALNNPLRYVDPDGRDPQEVDPDDRNPQEISRERKYYLQHFAALLVQNYGKDAEWQATRALMIKEIDITEYNLLMENIGYELSPPPTIQPPGTNKPTSLDLFHAHQALLQSQLGSLQPNFGVGPGALVGPLVYVGLRAVGAEHETALDVAELTAAVSNVGGRMIAGRKPDPTKDPVQPSDQRTLPPKSSHLDRPRGLIKVPPPPGVSAPAEGTWVFKKESP